MCSKVKTWRWVNGDIQKPACAKELIVCENPCEQDSPHWTNYITKLTNTVIYVEKIGANVDHVFDSIALL